MINVNRLGMSKFLEVGVALAFVVVGAKSEVLRGSESPGSICEIQNGVKGRCESVTSCLQDGGVATRNGTMKMCAKAGGVEHVCCRRPFRIAEHVCSYWKSYWRDNNGLCIEGTPTIVGGEDAQLGQFPEIGLLGIKRKRRKSWICGATLLSPHFALTAAHCVLDFVQYVIRFGDHNIYVNEPTSLPRVVGAVPSGLFRENDLHFETRKKAPTKQIVEVDEVIIHPEYDHPYNDLALLKFKQHVVLTKRVLPVCLPTVPREDYLGHILTAAGWGRVKYESYKFSEVLQKVDLPVIDRMTCWEDLERLNARLIPKGFPQELLCAGEEGKDSCKGDSGGPLLLQVRDSTQSSVPCEHTIAGVVSFGSGCGRFGVYGRVSAYLDWITGYIAPGVVPNPAVASNTAPSSQPSPPLGGGQAINFPG